MNNELNDFVVDIVQDFNELNSILKILKDSVNNENKEITIEDISNSLEIIISKAYSTKLSLEKCLELV